MNLIHDKLYTDLKHILEKNIDIREHYLRASQIAKEDDVKLFFKNKAHNRGMFIKRLMSELHLDINTFMIDKQVSDNLQNQFTKTTTQKASSDSVLLRESLKTDKQTLMDFEALLKHPTLPFTIRLIINEKIIFIRLDELKREQLFHICK